MQKHTPGKLSELESQVAQQEDELKKAKEQLKSSNIVKRQAQEEAEETKNQLLELSNSEDSQIKELRKFSQEHDRVWQFEVEAIQKQHSMDSAALASALNEIQKLKSQIEMVAESKATQTMRAESAHTEIENLRVELLETYSLVENIKNSSMSAKDLKLMP